MSDMEHSLVRVQERINHIEKLQQIQQSNLEEVCGSVKELRITTDSFIRDIHRDIAAIRIELAKPSGVSWPLALTLNGLSVLVTALTMYVLTGTG